MKNYKLKKLGAMAVVLMIFSIGFYQFMKLLLLNPAQLRLSSRSGMSVMLSNQAIRFGQSLKIICRIQR